MKRPTKAWLLDPACLLEIFILANVSFLAVDIYVAHSMNGFAKPIEWLPIAFSIVATAVLVLAFPLENAHLTRGWRRTVGLLFGWAALAVGIGGMFLHLENQFFLLFTVKSLVYAAPFVAPLAYAGIGFLILMNRMVDVHSREWGRWVIFFALGGTAGNFLLSVLDHAQNGFFAGEEWWPVYTCAYAVAFLACAMAPRVGRVFLALCFVVVVAQAGMGLLGLYFHGTANLAAPAESIRDRFVFGAPIFAPLLLPNISLLAALGLWHLWMHAPRPEPKKEAVAAS